MCLRNLPPFPPLNAQRGSSFLFFFFFRRTSSEDALLLNGACACLSRHCSFPPCPSSRRSGSAAGGVISHRPLAAGEGGERWPNGRIMSFPAPILSSKRRHWDSIRSTLGDINYGSTSHCSNLTGIKYDKLEIIGY